MAKLEREKAYGSYMTQPGTITLQDREAAEVLLQMGLGMGASAKSTSFANPGNAGNNTNNANNANIANNTANVIPTVQRKSIITETRSAAVSELTLKPTGAPSSVIVSTMPMSNLAKFEQNLGKNGPVSAIVYQNQSQHQNISRGEPSAFVPFNIGGGYSLVQSPGQGQKGQQGVHSLGPGISIHPAVPVTPQRVPVSVVQRKETIGRNRRTLSSPPGNALNSLSHLQGHNMPPAITIRPISMDGNNREIVKRGKAKGQQYNGQASNPNPLPPSSSVIKREKEPSIPSLNGMARTELDVLLAEPDTPTPINGSNGTFSGPDKKGSASSSRNDNIMNMNNMPQSKFASAIPITLGPGEHSNIQANVPWLLANAQGARIRIVSPSQLGSGPGGLGSSGGLLIHGTNLIHISSGGSKKELGASNSAVSSGIIHNSSNNINNNNNSSENASTDQQRLRQTKALKKALRTKAPMSRDASEPIAVDGFKIPKEYWAKAFVQSDICHAAGILFKALFTPEEIQNCTLRGRNGTFLLDLKKRSAIFRAVGWMKNKNQNPYSFDSATLGDIDLLTQDEKLMIEKKVFVERRYQTSRKIRDVPASNNPKRRSNKSNNQNQNDVYHQQQNSLTILSSEESNPPLEIIVKAEPRDLLGKDFKENSDTEHTSNCDGENPIEIKREKEEPMELEEDNNIDHIHNASVEGDGGPESAGTTNSERERATEISQPSSPKQIKLMAF